MATETVPRQPLWDLISIRATCRAPWDRAARCPSQAHPTKARHIPRSARSLEPQWDKELRTHDLKPALAAVMTRANVAVRSMARFS